MAIILPCLFPCGAPLGVNMCCVQFGCFMGTVVGTYAQHVEDMFCLRNAAIAWAQPQGGHHRGIGWAI